MFAYIRSTGASIEVHLENGRTAGFPLGEQHALIHARAWAKNNGATSIEEWLCRHEKKKIVDAARDFLTVACNVPKDDVSISETITEVDDGYWVATEVFIRKSDLEEE